MPSAHWNIDAAILTWVRAESKRLGRSTSQVVSSILMAAKAQEEFIATPSVAAWLESAQYDDTTEEEQRTLGEAAALLRRRWSER